MVGHRNEQVPLVSRKERQPTEDRFEVIHMLENLEETQDIEGVPVLLHVDIVQAALNAAHTPSLDLALPYSEYSVQRRPRQSAISQRMREANPPAPAPISSNVNARRSPVAANILSASNVRWNSHFHSEYPGPDSYSAA